MTPSKAPVGTVIVVGHPGNGITATKQDDGEWLTNDTPRAPVGYDDLHKASTIVYTPGGAS